MEVCCPSSKVGLSSFCFALIMSSREAYHPRLCSSTTQRGRRDSLRSGFRQGPLRDRDICYGSFDCYTCRSRAIISGTDVIGDRFFRVSTCPPVPSSSPALESTMARVSEICSPASIRRCQVVPVDEDWMRPVSSSSSLEMRFLRLAEFLRQDLITRD